MIKYSFSDTYDLKTIAHFLQKNDLPFSDLQESRIKFIIAKNLFKIIGSIGIEKYKTDGLLRSFAIDSEYRKKGYGKKLVDKLLLYAVQNNIKTLHLLTNKAEKYFLNEGFKVLDRIKAPESIKNSAEFKSLCPATSTYMVLEELSKHINYFSEQLNSDQQDLIEPSEALVWNHKKGIKL